MIQTSVAIVIPAYNEAKTIAGVVSGARNLGDVIVVDDCSHDNTLMLASRAGADVIQLGRNSGYESALNAGIAKAFASGYEFVITMDADGQHLPESARCLLATLGNADIAIGLRQRKQRIVEWVAGWIGSLLWRVPDPFCGLKLYRSSSCKALAPFDRYNLVGAELFVRAKCAGLKIVTIHIKTPQRQDVPRFDTNWRANLRLAKACILLTAIHLKML